MEALVSITSSVRTPSPLLLPFVWTRKKLFAEQGASNKTMNCNCVTRDARDHPPHPGAVTPRDEERTPFYVVHCSSLTLDSLVDKYILLKLGTLCLTVNGKPSPC